jgi:hypothetical protein
MSCESPAAIQKGEKSIESCLDLLSVKLLNKFDSLSDLDMAVLK